MCLVLVGMFPQAETGRDAGQNAYFSNILLQKRDDMLLLRYHIIILTGSEMSTLADDFEDKRH